MLPTQPLPQRGRTPGVRIFEPAPLKPLLRVLSVRVTGSGFRRDPKAPRNENTLPPFTPD
jgi:hypothetical protein